MNIKAKIPNTNAIIPLIALVKYKTSTIKASTIRINLSAVPMFFFHNI